MDTKNLLTAIISFIAGGLLVSVAATTFDKPAAVPAKPAMQQPAAAKTGDAYDAAFLQMMILHHQDAVAMSLDARTRAKHDQIKQLAAQIITAQNSEIDQMQLWQRQWGYTGAATVPAGPVR